LNLLTKRNRLIKTADADLSKNFIAIGMEIILKKGTNAGNHTALIICLRGELFMFHYLPTGIIFCKATEEPKLESYYHKELNYFSTSDTFIEAVLSRFDSIKKRSKIMYSMIFDASRYGQDGTYSSSSGLPEFSTCVGFCINVLSGLIIESDQFVQASDWDNFDITHPNLQDFILAAKEAYPELDESLYESHHKRITPEECTLTGYFKNDAIPIRKAKLDELIGDFYRMINLLPLAANKTA